MAELTITINDAIALEVLRDFTDFHGWNAELGPTRLQFAKSVLVQYIRDSVHNFRNRQDRAQVEDENQAEVEGMDIT